MQNLSYVGRRSVEEHVMNDDHPWDSINNGWWDGNRQLLSVMDTHSKRRAHHWPLPIGIRFFCHAHLKEIERSLQPEQPEQVEDLLQSAEPDHINMTWHPRGHTRFPKDLFASRNDRNRCL